MLPTITTRDITVTHRPVSTTPRWRMTTALEATVATVPTNQCAEPQQASTDDRRSGFGRVDDVDRRTVGRARKDLSIVGGRRRYDVAEITDRYRLPR